jgi:hypothetical protein
MGSNPFRSVQLPDGPLYARSFRQRFLLVVSRRTETVIGPVHQPETNRLRCTYLAFSILASLRRSVSSDSNAEVDAICVLPASLPISILAFVLGAGAPRLSVLGGLLFNGILICRGRRHQDQFWP